MIKRLAVNLLKQNKRPFYIFSQDTKTKFTSVQQQKQKKSQNYDKFNDQQPEDQQPYIRQNRNTKGWIIYRIFFWSCTAMLAYNTYLVANHPTNKKTPVQQEPGAIPGFISAAKYLYSGYSDAVQFLTKPPVSKLLPDAVHPQLQQKTLVLNLTGTLLNAQYVFGKGLILHKRPGLQQFLKKMSQLYEVVIFSNDDPMFLSSVIPSIDPKHRIITSYFGNQCMTLSRGHYIKDLSYLNRDLKKIVVVDKSKDNVLKNKENVITLTQYKGDEADRQLIQLTSLLQNLANSEIKDIRKVLEEMGDHPLQKYDQIIKQKQQKLKNSRSNRFFGFFDKKN